MSDITVSSDLEEESYISQNDIDRFDRDGFVHLKSFFSTDVLKQYIGEITRVVNANNPLTNVPFEERSTYDKAFIQVMNLWRMDEKIKEFVFGKDLARAAATLLGVNSVRIYHDQALYKEAGGGLTPWHTDQYYWPLSNPKTCVAWIPFQDTPLEMGPLAFARTSHKISHGRDLKISDESEETLKNALSHLDDVTEPFELGDVSFHYGWTFHHAQANHTAQDRRVMTIIFMDSEIRLKAPENPNQQADWDSWCPGVKVGELVDSPINPVLYSAG